MSATLFIVNQQVLQNVANYLVERPFKEVAQILNDIQTSAVVTDASATVVQHIVSKNFEAAAEEIKNLLPEKAPPEVKKSQK